MTSPAVVALKCTTALERIDRGEILFYDNQTLSRDESAGVAVVTAEAVTIYKGHGKDEISVPITVLGKTEVLMKRRDDGKVTQEFTGTAANAGDPLYYEYDVSNKKVSISTTKGGGKFLGIAVHSIGTRTSSVDVIVNFAA